MRLKTLAFMTLAMLAVASTAHADGDLCEPIEISLQATLDITVAELTVQFDISSLLGADLRALGTYKLYIDREEAVNEPFDTKSFEGKTYSRYYYPYERPSRIYVCAAVDVETALMYGQKVPHLEGVTVKCVRLIATNPEDLQRSGDTADTGTFGQ